VLHGQPGLLPRRERPTAARSPGLRGRRRQPGIEAPYRIGYADFPGGLRVCGRFTGPDVVVGDPVEVVAMVIRQQPPDPLTGWAFRKAAA
jgi:uncharacterized OB-fold protein